MVAARLRSGSPATSGWPDSWQHSVNGLGPDCSSGQQPAAWAALLNMRWPRTADSRSSDSKRLMAAVGVPWSSGRTENLKPARICVVKKVANGCTLTHFPGLLPAVERMNSSQLPNNIRSLPIAERVRLAEEIWNSIVEDEREFELDPQQLKMLQNRVASHRECPESGIAWTRFKADILGE